MLNGRHVHGVLAAHLIGEGGHPILLFHPVDHIQIGHAGFDHHHVRPFGDIHPHLDQGLIAIGGIHLVALLAALAQIGGRADGIAEGAVVVGGILGRVGHDLGMAEAMALQGFADGADAAIHHVGGGHHIGSCQRMGEGLLHQGAGGHLI